MLETNDFLCVDFFRIRLSSRIFWDDTLLAMGTVPDENVVSKLVVFGIQRSRIKLQELQRYLCKITCKEVDPQVTSN